MGCDTVTEEPRTPCQEYGHEYETEPEDITLHACTEPGCGDWYRD
jgi:hypothetical protein